MSPEVETAIIERIDALGLFRVVKPLAEIAAQSVPAQITPAAYVGFDGYAVTDTSSDHRSAKITERWAVVVVVKSARQGDGGQEARIDALSLGRSVFEALAGYTPPIAKSRELIPVTPDRPIWDAGFYWLPLSFIRHTILNTKD